MSTGAVDEMSFAFRVKKQTWNEDYTGRRIEAVDLDRGDVNVVNYGANPHTAGSPAMRALLRQLEASRGRSGAASFDIFRARAFAPT